MGSTRLPGKTLADLNGKPLLGHLLDRLLQCKTLDQIVVATTKELVDKQIKTYCDTREVHCYQGPSQDVLLRLKSVFIENRADIGVVVYGDGPIIDPDIIDYAVNLYKSRIEIDLVCNDLKTSFPPGMEVEVLNVKAICKADEICSDLSIREHGTLFVRQNPELFRIYNFEAEGPLRKPNLSLEVDVAEDLELLTRISKHFHNRSSYSLREIIEYIEENNLQKLNEHIVRRWKKYRKDD